MLSFSSSADSKATWVTPVTHALLLPFVVGAVFVVAFFVAVDFLRLNLYIFV